MYTYLIYESEPDLFGENDLRCIRRLQSASPFQFHLDDKLIQCIYEIFLLRFPQSGEKCKTGDVDGRLLAICTYYIYIFLCNEEITNNVDDAISVRATFNFSSESRSSCNGFLKSENAMDDGMQKL